MHSDAGQYGALNRGAQPTFVERQQFNPEGFVQAPLQHGELPGPSEEITEEDLQEIYNWVDEIPLSRPKRNI